MTVFDATGKLFEWFESHDHFQIDTDFKTLTLISDHPSLEKAIVMKALEELEGAEFLVSVLAGEEKYFVLKKPLHSFEQQITLAAPTCMSIASHINTFCEKTGDKTNMCDVRNIEEKDVQNLMWLIHEASNESGDE
jgi:hypothetical protein